MKKKISVKLFILYTVFVFQNSAAKPVVKKMNNSNKLLYASLGTTATGLTSLAFLAYWGGQFRKDKFINSAFSSALIAQPLGLPPGIGAYTSIAATALGLSGTMIAIGIKSINHFCQKKPLNNIDKAD